VSASRTDEAWERFAQESAEYYILTESGFTPGHVDVDRFFALGERDAESIIAQVRPWLRGSATAVDIGCGVGRLSIPMAKRFERVVAIDVSPTMLARCGENCAARGIENVTPLHATEAAGQRLAADLVFSHLVLQHIEDFETIRRYAALTFQWLGDTGVASLQFDTRPRTRATRLAQRLPDRLLPRTRRRGIRRVRRSRADVAALLREAGLEVVAEIAPDTAEHVFIATRRARASS
jgi:2-polyprenyl-3-methyl-5-hydroxy-6-metoxy-1,4-benzoquinol methylase